MPFVATGFHLVRQEAPPELLQAYDRRIGVRRSSSRKLTRQGHCHQRTEETKHKANGSSSIPEANAAEQGRRSERNCSRDARSYCGGYERRNPVAGPVATGMAAGHFENRCLRPADHRGFVLFKKPAQADLKAIRFL
jgi:hypothetical protein